ncbi:hypothetical protein D3C75_573740 [compost metagenome]
MFPFLAKLAVGAVVSHIGHRMYSGEVTVKVNGETVPAHKVEIAGLAAVVVGACIFIEAIKNR